MLIESCRLDEEMIETLFIVNTPKPNPKDATRWQVLPSPGQDHGDRVLDPKKAQNIAILLKALHVTVDEVCEGLMEGSLQHFPLQDLEHTFEILSCDPNILYIVFLLVEAYFSSYPKRFMQPKTKN